MCELWFGVAWDGTACVGLSGCTCEGTDCDSLYPTMDACLEARWSCMRSMSCVTDADCGVGDYCEPCATSSCFGCEDCIAGCVPHGCRDEAPLTCRRLRPDCGSDGVAIVAADGCWQCVERTTCAPIPGG